jgi:endonuclease/exonuclease/phosphatase family metal-dependent hydrolase
MGGRLRVLSANLQNGGADPDALAGLVESLRADVVCVQELAADQAAALCEVLPHGSLEPHHAHMGLGVALRHPAEVRRLPLSFRDGRVVRLEPGGWPGLAEAIEIVNVHIVAPTCGAHWRSPRRRGDQLRGLLAHVDASPAQRRVVVGDFNATPVWPVYRGVASRLQDVHRTLARERGVRPRRTWPAWPWLRGVRLLRIDHCFAHGLRVEAVRVVPVPGSDHDGLAVDIALD